MIWGSYCSSISFCQQILQGQDRYQGLSWSCSTKPPKPLYLYLFEVPPNSQHWIPTETIRKPFSLQAHQLQLHVCSGMQSNDDGHNFWMQSSRVGCWSCSLIEMDKLCLFLLCLIIWFNIMIQYANIFKCIQCYSSLHSQVCFYAAYGTTGVAAAPVSASFCSEMSKLAWCAFWILTPSRENISIYIYIFVLLTGVVCLHQLPWGWAVPSLGFLLKQDAHEAPQTWHRLNFAMPLLPGRTGTCWWKSQQVTISHSMSQSPKNRVLNVEHVTQSIAYSDLRSLQRRAVS